MKNTQILLNLILLAAVAFALGFAVGYERAADNARIQVKALEATR